MRLLLYIHHLVITCRGFQLLCYSALCIPGLCIAQTNTTPSAKFSFNNHSSDEDITHKKAKLVGVSYTKDRFGNPKSAVYLSGNQHSYINLGNYPGIKPEQGSISLWVNMEFEISSGSGYKINPVILTKSYDGDDFYESYGIYYSLEGNRIAGLCTQDSLRQIAVFSSEPFTHYTWHHLVLTYDDNWLCFYIDGKPEGRIQKGFTTRFSETDSVVIGISANKKNDRFFNGSIDDIEFYSSVLTAEEVMDLFHAPNPDKNTIMAHRVMMILMALVVLLGIYLLIKYQLSLTLKKEKDRLEVQNKLLEMELRVNRALMDPHFIFNSLNALQNYILKSKIEGAIDYLAKFSKLIRRMLEGNTSNTITLAMEIELLEGYLEIENLRFKEKIRYSVTLDQTIMPLLVKIPVMMLQPFVENAIWHGLQLKEGDKELTISFAPHEKKYLLAVIEDNGLGRKTDLEKKTEKKSMATRFLIQRLTLLNKLYDLNCGLTIIDKPGGQGTIVKLILPVYID